MMPWFTDCFLFKFIDFKPKEVYHAARFEKGSRYYVIQLEKDLLGDWTIRAFNGRIKSKLGQCRTLAFPTFTDAFTCFCDIAKLRFQRAYYIKTIASENIIFLSLLPFIAIDNSAHPLKNRSPLNKKEKELMPAPSIKKLLNQQQIRFQF
ncbi:MAG: hypothetical protein H0U57_13605 [Tatlockia sp.]|nr:hypothetical protein [Tatlockia sp.]